MLYKGDDREHAPANGGVYQVLYEGRIAYVGIATLMNSTPNGRRQLAAGIETPDSEYYGPLTARPSAFIPGVRSIADECGVR
jgi:hypothetical protein